MQWPTYNVADIAITVGVILLVGDILFNKESPMVAAPATDDDAKAV
jgi:lipoprotein signal peptidase